ncbi:ABC transporter permease [Fictibacillus gelatini]|uniref:ABC transporter permease n=1 Tax=Fictibacillus gelatini TaxID=225985 RepID=UPI00041DF5C3|nr:ABC transporter permease [Fictibacillus gelatini]
MRKLRNTDHNLLWKKIVFPAWLLLLLLVLWEAAVRIFQIEKWILPGPLSIVKALIQSKDLLIDHSIQTIYETLIGLGAAIIIGVIIAVVIESSEMIRLAVYPLLVISQTVPIIAVAPLFLMWFGYGLLPKVIVVALVCFFPIAVNLADGFRLVDRDKIRLLKSMGANRLQIFRMVQFPESMPHFFSGLRIAGTYSIMGAVIGEWLGASKGLGIFLTRSSQSFLTERVFAIILVIVILSLIIFGWIEMIARILMPWHYKHKKLQGK